MSPRTAAVVAAVIPLLILGAPSAPRAAEGVTRIDVVPGVERIEPLDPDALTAAPYRPAQDRPFWQRLLNIRSAFGVAWVALGLLGQSLFAGRLLVQWIASEKERRSIVPVSFWWMSLGGATMLIAYFVWRRDIVGVLGQSMGWLVYARNLILIRRGGVPA